MENVQMLPNAPKGNFCLGANSGVLCPPYLMLHLKVAIYAHQTPCKKHKQTNAVWLFFSEHRSLARWSAEHLLKKKRYSGTQ